MKRNILMAGMMAATMVALSACSSAGTTPETTVAVEATTTVETTTAEEMMTEADAVDNTTAETEAGTEAADKETTLMREFAEEVQDAVKDKDITWLADLCEYPVNVSLNSGEEAEVEDHDAFVALGADNIFTDELLASIAAVNPEELEKTDDGVIMGEETNIILSMVDGAPAITGLNL